MKYIITFILIIPLAALAQSKKDNTIKVTGVSFNEAAVSLLDFGYEIEKSDSNFQTIKTEWKTGKADNKWMKLRLFVRIKDSVATVTGDWYNTMFMGQKVLGVEQTMENSVLKIEYHMANPKACFKEMKEFALSFKKPVEYLKN